MRFPFRFKIALLTATFSAVPLVVVGWLLIDVNAREVESSSQALQIGATERIAAQVDAEVATARGSLVAIAAALTDEEIEEGSRIPLALRLLDAASGFDVVAIYDVDGQLVDRMRHPDSLGARTPGDLDAPLRAAAVRDGHAISRASRSGEAPVHVLLVVPVRASDRLTWYAAAPFSLASVQRSIARTSQSQLATDDGAVFVVDQDRRVIAHPNEERLFVTEASIDPEAAARAPSSAEHTDRKGRLLLSTSVGLTEVPWAVVAQIPREVAYASLDQMRRIVLLTIAATLALAFAAAFFFSRRLARPIGSLVAFTKELAARRFDARVKVDTNDELGVLADALSSAAEELERSEARTREEAAIRADLGRYLPAELVDSIIRREQSMELGGQRLEITVLFADVVAFTPLSDRLPPEQVVALLNELFTLLTDAVFRHGGTVDKFVGDCVMALWGAPAPREDHAEQAILAAQDMLRFLESANDAWKERFGVEVQLAIGINSGEAVVGNVGSETRMEYTAIGDVVNIAARLETIARPQQILISRATKERATSFEIARVGEREVPGKSAPIELFEVAW
jgi:adenylate cyclase